MKLTILGSSAASPAKGGACSGYLVDEGSLRLLLDCGTGVLSNIQKVLHLREINDIVISHMHFDHFVDLIPLCYWRTYSPPGEVGEPPGLHLPPGGKQVLAGIVSAVGAREDFFERAFRVDEYSSEDVLHLGPLRLTFAQVPHYVPSYAVAVSWNPGAGLVFSADGAPSEALERLAMGATLLLCEAALEEPDESESPGHMTSAQAAHLARAASVRQLVLTHFWPWQNRRRALVQASAIFGQHVSIAKEGRTYIL